MPSRRRSCREGDSTFAPARAGKCKVRSCFRGAKASTNTIMRKANFWRLTHTRAAWSSSDEGRFGAAHESLVPLLFRSSAADFLQLCRRFQEHDPSGDSLHSLLNLHWLLTRWQKRWQRNERRRGCGGERRSASPGESAAKTLKSQLLGGSLTLLAGSGLVGVTNLLYNVVTARLLGPDGVRTCHGGLHDADAAVVHYAGLPGGVREICGQDASAEARAQVFASLHQRAWMAGHRHWPCAVSCSRAR